MDIENYKKESQERKEKRRVVVQVFSYTTIKSIYNELMGIPQDDRISKAIGEAIHGVGEQIFNGPKKLASEEQIDNVKKS